jgi:polysaccharide biosynthesis transport protein
MWADRTQIGVKRADPDPPSGLLAVLREKSHNCGSKLAARRSYLFARRETEPVERGNLLQLARRTWPILLTGAVVGGLVAHLAAARMQPTYQASVSLLAGPINADFDTQRAAGNIARTYSDLATSGPVLRETLRETKTAMKSTELRDNVSSTSNDITRIVELTVKAHDPDLAAQLANALAARLIALGTKTNASVVSSFMTDSSVAALGPGQQDAIRAAATRIFGTGSAGHLAVVDPAEVPTAAVAPRETLITGMGVIGGLLVASLLVFLRASTTSSIDTEDELTAVDGVPLLGTVSAGRSKDRGKLVVGADEQTDAAAAYRLLAAKVGFAQNGRPIRSLLVVDGGEGKSSGVTAANLAVALAEMEEGVMLVDANEGAITDLFGLAGRPGYAELLEQGVDEGPNNGDVAELTVPQGEELTVLPRGNASAPRVTELERTRRLLASLQREAAIVVVNAPSADRSSSGLIWARAADATLVVAERHKTKRGAIARALDSLKVADANVIGTVFRD